MDLFVFPLISLVSLFLLFVEYRIVKNNSDKKTKVLFFVINIPAVFLLWFLLEGFIESSLLCNKIIFTPHVSSACQSASLVGVFLIPLLAILIFNSLSTMLVSKFIKKRLTIFTYLISKLAAPFILFLILMFPRF